MLEDVEQKQKVEALVGTGDAERDAWGRGRRFDVGISRIHARDRRVWGKVRKQSLGEPAIPRTDVQDPAGRREVGMLTQNSMKEIEARPLPWMTGEIARRHLAQVHGRGG